MGLLPAEPSDADKVFVLLWCIGFGAMKQAIEGCLVFWCFQLLAVLSVLYLAAEPRLSRMSCRERCEMLCFAAVCMAILSYKVCPRGRNYRGRGRSSESLAPCALRLS